MGTDELVSKREFALRIPVANWILGLDLIPVVEIGSLNNCDMVGVKFATKPVRLVSMIAVELKLRNVPEVMRQCRRHRSRGLQTWAAMPSDVAAKAAERFNGTGIGLLGVSGGTATSIVDADAATINDLRHWTRAMYRRRDEYLWRMKDPEMIRLMAWASLKKSKEESK